MRPIVVGTSGWSAAGYEDWYARGLPPRDRLSWYAQRFDGVEVDSTFYALPGRRTVARWSQVTPPGFTFDIKLHRLLSRHAASPSSLPRELRERAQIAHDGRVVVDESLERAMCQRTLEAVAPLRATGKLSSFLLQLTPAFAPARHSLTEVEGVIEQLAPVPVAIELRHRDWLRDPERTLAWFRAAGAAFVCVDSPHVEAPIALPPVDAVTRDDLAYLRAHGRNAEAYLRGRTAAERFDWPYSEDELHEIASRARKLATGAAHVRLMFGNGAHALASAERAREILGLRPRRRARPYAIGAVTSPVDRPRPARS